MDPQTIDLMTKTKKFLRSALISSKGGLPAEQVYRDYRDLVGEGIPYRRLGYETLDSFLNSIPDVCRISRRPTGEVVVIGVADDSTKHIQELVNRQNSKTKKKSKPNQPSRRPYQQSTHWQAPPQMRPGWQSGGRFPGQRGRGGGYQGQGAGFRGPGRHNMTHRGFPTMQHRFPNGSQMVGGLPLREPRGGGNQGGRGGFRHLGGDGGGRGGHGGHGQSRPNTAVRQHSEVKTNFRKDVEQYFVSHNLGDLVFKIASMGSKGKEKYMATITVEGEQYKTYPQTYNSQNEAEEVLAGIIVKKLGILNSGSELGDGVVETSSITLYAERVVQIIGDRQNGIWSTQIEKQYSDNFPGEKLPSLWFQEVESLNMVRVDCPISGSGRYIVFPVQARKSNSPESRGVSPAPIVSASQVQPSDLGLPDDDLWDVFITFVRSTTQLSVRLIGEEYSEKFEELSSNMDLHYYDKAAIPRVGPRPEVGRIYAAQVSSDWHRVKVIEVRGVDCTCLFLDHGDEDKVSVEDLREIAPKFLELPSQAIMVQLAGLEDYEYSEAVMQHLNTFLLGKSLVAKIENRSSIGSSILARGQTWPRMVLFDTSSEDVDVNLNQKLIELLHSQDSQSKLPLPGGEEINVFVSVIEPESGDIYVQRESSTFSNMEKAIEEQSEEVIKRESINLAQQDKLYLAKYPLDGAIYRAVITSRVSEDKLEIFFVDYGNSAQVTKADVWEMGSITDSIVSEMPYQALRCRLEGVPPKGHSWSSAASKALREMVPESQLVNLRVVRLTGDISSVELHLPDSKDGSINFDLSTEFDIFPPLPDNDKGSTSPVEIETHHDPTSTSPLLSPDIACLKTLLSPVIPPEGHYYDVNVTFAVSPSNFVIQPYNEGTKLELLMTELNSFYNEPSHIKEGTGSHLSEGEYLSARHTDHFWYRVKVTRLIDVEHVVVRFVDYGDLSMVNTSDLQPLWGQFRNLPYQAINARLSGVLPAHGSDWTPEDTVWFNSRVSDSQFVSVVKGVEIVEGEPVVDLMLIDTTHQTEDKRIDQELIEDGRAITSSQSVNTE